MRVSSPLLLLLLLIGISCWAAEGSEDSEADIDADGMVGADQEGRLYFRDKSQSITLSRIIEATDTQTLAELQDSVTEQAATITNRTATISQLQNRLLTQATNISRLENMLASILTLLSPRDNSTTSTAPPTTTIVSRSNNITLEWVKLLGSSNIDRGNGITTDASGNIYVTGRTANSWLGSTVNGTSDAVVIKLSSHGTLLWAQLLGGSGTDFSRAIVVDHTGNVYIAGYTDSPSIKDSVANAGDSDLFLAKYTSNGSLVWVKLLGGTGSDDAFGVAVDSADFVYICGFTGSPSLGGKIPQNNSSYDVVVAKFDPGNGTLLWVQLLGGTDYDYGYSIAIDFADNLFITGRSLSSSIGSSNARNGSTFDILVAKFLNNGTLLWVQLLGGTGIEEAYGIATDSAGHAYITGNTGSSTVGSSNANNGSRDILVAKFNSSNGTPLWVRLLGSSGQEFGYGIATDTAGNVYIVGATDSTSLGGGSSSGSSSGANAGIDDIVVAKFNASTGTLLFVQLLGGNSTEIGRSITADVFGNVYITGASRSTTVSNGNSTSTGTVNSNTNAGEDDILVAKFV